MKAAKPLAVVLSLLSVAFAQPASAEWVMGDAKDIRIELRGFTPPDEPYNQVTYYKGPYQNASAFQGRSDLIAFGDLRRNDVPYMLAFYQTSTYFGYERLLDGLASFDFLKNAQIAYQSGERRASSRIGDVDYVLFTATDAASGLARSCVYWAGFFGGNRLVYKGLYCPAKAAVTDDDARLAVNAVALKASN